MQAVAVGERDRRREGSGECQSAALLSCVDGASASDGPPLSLPNSPGCNAQASKSVVGVRGGNLVFWGYGM